MTATRPSTIGTFTKKTHCQLSESTRSPPATTPSVPPRPARPPQTPIAMLRSRPCAKVTVRIASAAGDSNAPPSPWTARAAIRNSGEFAKPATSEVTPNKSRPATNTRRGPSRSAIRPPSSRKPPNSRVYALITHCRESAEKFRSAWMSGSATFTIVTSSTTMNCARANTASVAHGLRRMSTSQEMMSTLYVYVVSVHSRR